MYKVIERRSIVPNLHELTIEAPAVAESVQAGNFVIVRPDDHGERIPLSVAEWDREAGTVTSIFIGKETEITKYGTVLCVGGCYGIGSIYPIARALKEAGNRVYTLVEARSSFLLYWQDKLETVSDGYFEITRDGTTGRKGHVGEIPDMMRENGIEPDLVIANGCTFQMMKVSEVTRPLGWKTIVSMNPIMIDGTGMCGVCRLTIAGETKFACVDGPDFDGHEVDWEEFLARRKTYVPEEIAPLRKSGCRC
jgi:ferredoxin--NADP+ reductase